MTAARLLLPLSLCLLAACASAPKQNVTVEKQSACPLQLKTGQNLILTLTLFLILTLTYILTLTPLTQLQTETQAHTQTQILISDLNLDPDFNTDPDSNVLHLIPNPNLLCPTLILIPLVNHSHGLCFKNEIQ